MSEQMFGKAGKDPEVGGLIYSQVAELVKRNSINGCITITLKTVILIQVRILS